MNALLLSKLLGSQKPAVQPSDERARYLRFRLQDQKAMHAVTCCPGMLRIADFWVRVYIDSGEHFGKMWCEECNKWTSLTVTIDEKLAA